MKALGVDILTGVGTILVSFQKEYDWLPCLSSNNNDDGMMHLFLRMVMMDCYTAVIVTTTGF